MAHFAELDENNVVLRTLVVDNEVITIDGEEDESLGVSFLQGLFGESTKWKQTSFNGTFRKNFAGNGMTYDEERDCFLSLTAPYPSWVFDESLAFWQAPVPYPTAVDGKRYAWDEDSTSWKDID